MFSDADVAFEQNRTRIIFLSLQFAIISFDREITSKLHDFYIIK